MHLTQHVNFEICTECNLGHLHIECPNRHPDRFATLPTPGPMSDDLIVEIVEDMYQKHGFTGNVGFHYYNDPLMAADRMWRLMDRITERVPKATFVLWTNGILLPEDCRGFNRFAEVHVSIYKSKNGTILPIRNLAGLLCERSRLCGAPIQMRQVELDDRLHAIGDVPTASTSGCNRMFTELDIDYHGNVHLCCYDWAGGGTVGNVQINGLKCCLALWDEVRRQVSSDPIHPDAPETCQRCRVRSMSMLSWFIPRIAQAAQDTLGC